MDFEGLKRGACTGLQSIDRFSVRNGAPMGPCAWTTRDVWRGPEGACSAGVALSGGDRLRWSLNFQS